jgi:hypothetical protein
MAISHLMSHYSRAITPCPERKSDFIKFYNCTRTHTANLNTLERARFHNPCEFEQTLYSKIFIPTPNALLESVRRTFCRARYQPKNKNKFFAITCECVTVRDSFRTLFKVRERASALPKINTGLDLYFSISRALARDVTSCYAHSVTQ